MKTNSDSQSLHLDSFSRQNVYFPDNLGDYAPWVARHGLRAEYRLCQCGCGELAPVARKTSDDLGHRVGEPVRYICGHSSRRPLEERFWEKVDKRNPDQCWEWTGARDQQGYGSIRPFRKASRASWVIHFGSIPDGMYICHRCDNPSCVNPSHLFLGTNADNLRDMRAKGRAYNPGTPGEKNVSAKLTEIEVTEIRSRYANGEGSHSQLAAHYGVSSSLIGQIIKRQIWKHI